MHFFWKKVANVGLLRRKEVILRADYYQPILWAYGTSGLWVCQWCNLANWSGMREEGFWKAPFRKGLAEEYRKNDGIINFLNELKWIL